MNMQDALGVMADNNNDLSTYVDIVFVIDGTGSMQPLINKVKTLALSLHEKLEEGLRENKRRIDNLRAKVIVFRDYYVDGNAAMEESVFSSCLMRIISSMTLCQILLLAVAVMNQKVVLKHWH